MSRLKSLRTRQAFEEIGTFPCLSSWFLHVDIIKLNVRSKRYMNYYNNLNEISFFMFWFSFVVLDRMIFCRNNNRIEIDLIITQKMNGNLPLPKKVIKNTGWNTFNHLEGKDEHEYGYGSLSPVLLNSVHSRVFQFNFCYFLFKVFDF